MPYHHDDSSPDRRRESPDRYDVRKNARTGQARAVRRAPAQGAPRPMTARDVAVRALAACVRDHAYPYQALDRLLERVVLKNEDRRFAAALTYSALENRLYLDWVLDQLIQERPTDAVWDILHIAAVQLLLMDRIPDHAAVDEAVKQVRRTGGASGSDGFVNGVLRTLIRARDQGDIRLPDRDADFARHVSVRHSLAEPAVRRLLDAYGPEMAEQIAAWRAHSHALSVRPTLGRWDLASMKACFDRLGFTYRDGLVPGTLCVSGAGNIARLPEYRQGLFSIQSQSSMLAAMSVEARAGMQILDACAAPGGKACLMAEQMGSSGRVHAWDLYPHRVELIRASAKRLWLDNIRFAQRDARRVPEDLEGTMDAVLVDAPCSGLGVMTDKPDVRFRVTDEELDALVPLQRDILEACSRCVRPGGRLVYATCTLLPEENILQVRAFLERHPEFEPDRDDAWLPQALRPRMQDGAIQLFEHRDGIEGFFIARMRRRPA